MANFSTFIADLRRRVFRVAAVTTQFRRGAKPTDGEGKYSVLLFGVL